MNNQHNPIAQLITSIQEKWLNEVSPHEHIKLVRWMIKPDQARLYEGFLRLESTPNGSLPEVPLVLLTHFESETTYSNHLIKDWIENFKKDETLHKDLSDRGITLDWDIEHFEKQHENVSDHDLLLLEMLSTFQKAMPDNKLPLVLSLYPYSVSSPEAYAKWINQMMQIGLPDRTRLMVFDYAHENYFNQVFKTHTEQSKSLSVPLDLQGAINKIASSGNPNDPEVQFRKCMIEMSKAVSKNKLNSLHHWGEKGMAVTQKTGQKSAFATAHVIYAGNLFHFKEFEQIDTLLKKGITIAKQGVKAEDQACISVLIQAIGFSASSKQLQKQKEEAADLFCKQADTAITHGFAPQALSAWWLGYNVIKKRDKKRYKTLVQKAYEYGITQKPELLQSTCMAYIAADYYNIADKNSDDTLCAKIHLFMTEVENETWRETVEEHRKEMEKKSLSIFNWF